MAGSPSWMTPRSVLVPPMSKVRTLWKPARWPTSRALITPPAGPEWQILAGTCAGAAPCDSAAEC